MTNQIYEKGRQQFIAGGFDWTSGSASSFGVVLCASEYSVDIVVDSDLSDIAAANRVASTGLANLTASDGVGDADDTVLSTVSGSVVNSIVVFRWTGTETTSSLIAYIDTATGLPLTPNGADVTIQWSSGGCKIFRI